MKRAEGQDSASADSASEPARKQRRRRRARRGPGEHDRSDVQAPSTVPRKLAATPVAEPRRAPSPASRTAAVVARDEHPESAEDRHVEPREPWGIDDDSPAPAIALAAEFPPDAPETDPEPLTFGLEYGPGSELRDDVANVVGVRFVPAGRVFWYDAGDDTYAPGDRVFVDTERGRRLGSIATAPCRKPVRERLRRVLRRADERDLNDERSVDASHATALRVAKDTAAALRLPLKVFRVELSNGKILIYYTSDERIDVREFTRRVSQAMPERFEGHGAPGGRSSPEAARSRIELRQLGGRDEAKLVGGIGSCGLTLCCTTWLPEFVPVSIKMAKDQGLALSPSKVSGQCGRLKCCLVYEQAGYAELRKGLPKLGKRVISARGEGRVVEVDVLSQRVRVSYGQGETEMLPANAVTPKFPSGPQPRKSAKTGQHELAVDPDDLADHDDDTDTLPDQDPSRSLDLPPHSLIGSAAHPGIAGVIDPTEDE